MLSQNLEICSFCGMKLINCILTSSISTSNSQHAPSVDTNLEIGAVDFSYGYLQSFLSNDIFLVYGMKLLMNT